MSSQATGVRLAIKRLANFLNVFRRSKRGMLGLVIIVTLLIVALSAPLLSPYDPTTTYVFPKIAYKLSKPSWYKYLFSNENISQNVDPVPDPYFRTAGAVGELELTSTLTSAIHSEFASDKGFQEGSGPGSMAIVFEREADIPPYGENQVNLTKEFNYPYAFPPQQFLAQVAILVDNPQNLTIKTNIILEKVGGERRITWSSEAFMSTTGGWLTPYPPMDSDNYFTRDWLGDNYGSGWFKAPAKMMFTESGNYNFGLEMIINDTNPGKSKVTISVDDFFLKVYGNSFGILGTDQHGRDVFTQLVWGARISLMIGLATALFTTVIGLSVGLAAGYIGGFVDQILMRFTDMLLVIPDTPLYIVLMAVLNPSIWTLILLMTVLGWTGFARISRSQVLSLKERPFVEAAKAIGAGKLHIIVRHIVPNVMSLVYVALATAVPTAIINEAWLSWLGLYDPTVMTWGRMLHDIETEASGIYMWWWVIPPGISIAAISLAFILIGYALDEILNPKFRERH